MHPFRSEGEPCSARLSFAFRGFGVSAQGDRFFRQIVGIPQGSVLSSLLCNLYYGWLETTKVAPLISDALCAQIEHPGENSDGGGRTQVVDGAPPALSRSSSSSSPPSSPLPLKRRVGALAAALARRRAAAQRKKTKCIKQFAAAAAATATSSAQKASAAVVSPAGPPRRAPPMLLMRLVDDSLFITTSKEASGSCVRSCSCASSCHGFRFPNASARSIARCRAT